MTTIMKESINSEFVFSDQFDVTHQVKRAFDYNGYVIVRQLCTRAELTALEKKTHEDIAAEQVVNKEGETSLRQNLLWTKLGEDISGLLPRTDKFAGIFEQLIGCELYHFHSKLILREGGKRWHQDFGEWDHFGLPLPGCGTMAVAIDDYRRENGCLEFLKGSHQMGKVLHVKEGQQQTIEPARLEMARKLFPPVQIVLQAGDAVFFHCNLMHYAEEVIGRRQWAYLVRYNRVDNSPMWNMDHPENTSYTPLKKIRNSEVTRYLDSQQGEA